MIAGVPDRVWTYWEGPCPDYIGMCLESIRRRSSATVLDRAAFDAIWTEDRDLPIDDLYVAHRADFIRAYLLRHHGGMWIDADCIVLAGVGPLVALLERCDLVAYREPTGSIANSLLVARAHAPIVKAYYDAVADHLRQRRPIAWMEIGSVPLTAAIQAYPDRAIVLSPERIMPISWNESAKFLDAAAAGFPGPDDAYCYMLSNHSMPSSVRSATRDELLAGRTLLAELFRTALGVGRTSASYRYWRETGGQWEAEYDRRKGRHPYYYIAEMMLLDHIAHHAPCRVLEWGCGTGRHLRNLVEVPGVEAFGFDQSASMVEAMTWPSSEWRASHVTVGEPTGALPYPDGDFDVVFTCEALLHTPPEDLPGRLSELVRVCRGHIVHIEAPPTWRDYSPSCDGCWGHDLIAAYRALGLQCETGPAGSSRQTPYLVAVRPGSLRWRGVDAMLALYRRMERQVEDRFAAEGVVAHS